MFTVKLSVLLALCGFAAMAVVIQALLVSISQAAAIRRALDECPDSRELRFVLREVVVRYNDGKVVPLRQRPVVSQPVRVPARAAAA